jgi:ribosome-associated protein
MVLKDHLETWLGENMAMSFSRSGGPGGQNVNKVNTKVTARVSIVEIAVLTESQKFMIREKLHSRINEEGELVISVSDTRSQLKNREIALVRMLNLILSALHVQKKRKKTRPSRAAREKRLDNKRKISEKKSSRRSVDY